MLEYLKLRIYVVRSRGKLQSHYVRTKLHSIPQIGSNVASTSDV